MTHHLEPLRLSELYVSDLGSGKVTQQRIERSRTPIGAWVAAVALLPLGFVLRRRNF